jgi:hypothetical protein
MIKINVDFKYYLESAMVLYQIPHSEEWVQFHPNEADLFIDVNFHKTEIVSKLKEQAYLIDEAFKNKSMLNRF